MRVLVTGANGFVGKSLIKSLVREGHEVVALVRNKFSMKAEKTVTLLEGDLLIPDKLPELEKIDKAFYLVHGLKENSDQFEYLESTCAVNFINWIRPTNPGIIYLGGLIPKDSELSPHLRSRKLTGAILGASGLSVIEFRASIILGEGSLSFEMIKAMAQRFPIIPDIPLLNQNCGPLALDDLLSYFLLALKHNGNGHEIFEIGIKDHVPYGKLIELYSKKAGLRRTKIKVPDVDKKIMMKMLDFAVPEYSLIGKKLVDSLEYPTIVTQHDALSVFNEIVPMDLDKAMSLACERSQTIYPPIWEKDFLKFMLSEKIFSSSMPEVLLKLEKLAKLRNRFTK